MSREVIDMMDWTELTVLPKGRIWKERHTKYLQIFNKDEQDVHKTPGFYALKREYEALGLPLPVNPYARRVMQGGLHSSVVYSGKWRYPYPGPPAKAWLGGQDCSLGLVYHVNGGMSWATFVGMNPELRALALNNAKSKFQRHIENVIVEAPTEIAELHKTAALVGHRAKQLADFAEKFIKDNAKLRRRAIRLLNNALRDGKKLTTLKQLVLDLNSMYLEYTYGWTPLMLLFEDASTLLKDKMDSHVARSKISGHDFQVSSSIGSVEKNKVFVVSSTHAEFGRYDVSLVTEWRTDAWVGGLLLGPSNRDDWKQQLGFSGNNIIPTLWELTYLSFIADYFVNIGQYLGNLSNSLAKMNPETLYQSVKTTARQYWLLESRLTPDTRAVSPFFERSECVTQCHLHQALTFMNFYRDPITIPQARVELRLMTPSWGQLFNTLSVSVAVINGHARNFSSIR